MDAFCTYCSEGKTREPGKVPAIERYTSQRIRSVYVSALSVGQRFFILSGEYGFISASHPIPYYEHPLQAHEVDFLSRTVAAQLQQAGLRRLFYFTKAVEDDKTLAPYFNTAQRACQAASVELVTVILPQDA